MCICGSRGIMVAIRIGWGRVGKTMVDGRGCDRIEEFGYGGAFVGMGVVNGPIHRCEGSAGWTKDWINRWVNDGN
jgi:hypothetical protein